MKRAAYVITVSESTRRDVVDRLQLDPERVIAIHSGISPSFRPALGSSRAVELKTQLGIAPTARVILTVSGALEYKNVAAILRAMDILNPRRDTTTMFLRAGGDFSTSEKALIKQRHLEDCVVYAGSPGSDNELCDFYHLADVFVFPSLYEGFGWPPLEAMACGIPVVASMAGSLPEVLGDAALLVDPYDFNQLASSITRLLGESELRAEMIDRGLRRASGYRWERAARQTAAVYERMLRDRHELS